MLSKEERQYYARQSILSDIGEEAQLRLKKASVLILGMGGLGCPIAQTLATAGVGKIGILDFDKVSVSNLHRQQIYKYQDVGMLKVDVAFTYLTQLNPFIEIVPYHVLLSNEAEAIAIFDEYDIILDATDNESTKYLINDICVYIGRPLVYGSVFKFEGNVTVFNLMPKSPTLRCLFPQPKNDDIDCNIVGAYNVCTVVTGNFMANETIKIILQKNDILSGKLLVYNSLESKIDKFTFAYNSESVEISKKRFLENKKINITPRELEQLFKSEADIELIDVRTEEEHAICNIGGKLIPIDELEERFREIDTTKQIIIYCHHGIRSKYAIEGLAQMGFHNLLNLEGGIHAYAIEIDNTLTLY